MKEDAFFWQYLRDPEFPFCVLTYSTAAKADVMHWHDYLEIALCTGGEGAFLFEEKTYRVQPGDVFIINNQEKHVAITRGADTCDMELLLFLPQIISPPGNVYHTNEYLAPFWYNTSSFQHKVSSESVCSKQISQEMEEMKMLLKNKPRFYQSICDSSLRKILALLLEHYGNMKQTEDQDPSDRKRVSIDKALQYIHKHVSEHITLTELADLTDLSQSRFRHVFKEMMHMSFKEYLNKIRISKAQELLLRTNMSISTIIDQVGYTNEYYFYKLFEKTTDMTPSQYRNEYRLVV